MAYEAVVGRDLAVGGSMGDPDVPLFEVQTIDIPDGVLLRVSGEIDMATADRLANAFEAAYGSGRVVIDLSGVQFIDSAGLAVLISIRQELLPSHRTLTLQSPSVRVRKVLETAGVDRIFDIEEAPPKADPPVT